MKPWYDQYGYYCTGFDAHVQAYRYHLRQKFYERREAFSALAARR